MNAKTKTEDATHLPTALTCPDLSPVPARWAWRGMAFPARMWMNVTRTPPCQTTAARRLGASTPMVPTSASAMMDTKGMALFVMMLMNASWPQHATRI